MEVTTNPTVPTVVVNLDRYQTVINRIGKHAMITEKIKRRLKVRRSPAEQIANRFIVFKKVRPLKIGIRWDLIEAGASDKVICAVLEAYTSTREYYLACRRGAKRYNMYGCPEGCVSALEQAYADERLTILEMIAGCRPLNRDAFSFKKTDDSND